MLALNRLAGIERNRFAVLAHPHQVMAEVGLVALLHEVQGDLRPADVMGDDTAQGAVQHRHPDHEAIDAVGLAAQVEAQFPRQRPQDAHKAGQRDHRVEQAHAERHGVGGKEVDVFLNALIGVVGQHCTRAAGIARQLHAVEAVVGQPALQVVVGHPAAPAQLEHLGQVEAVNRNEDEGKGQVAKAQQFAPEDGFVLVLQGVVKHPVPVVDQHQHIDRGQIERNDGRQQAARLPALIRLKVRQGQGPDPAGEHGEGLKFGKHGHEQPRNGPKEQGPIVAVYRPWFGVYSAVLSAAL